MANHDSGPGPGPHCLARQPLLNTANEVVPPTLASISPILRVATEVEAERPRVAYLCRFYTFEKYVQLDPKSTGQGVRQFKTALRRRIEWENSSSLASRVERSDALEIESFYEQYYQNYVRSFDKEKTQLAKAYQTARVLFEVLCAVNMKGKSEEVGPEIIDVQEMNEIYAPYNILPLDAAGASQPIMQFDEVKAAVSSLSWHSLFEKQKKINVMLWHVCHVSIIHRSQFYLLFRGDPDDRVYMEVELRWLEWKDRQWLEQVLPNVRNASPAHLGDDF